ncbi:MAG: diguanylate cyclase [Anaerolineales bacterium]
MQADIRRLLKPPDLGDGDLNRRAGVLHIVLIILLIFTPLLLLIYYILVPEPRVGHVLIFAALAVELASFALLRAGKLRLAGRLLVYLLWAVLMVSTITSEGVRGTPILGQILLIVLSGLLITEPLALTLGALTIAGNYITMLLESRDFLIFPEQRLSLTTHWTIQSGYVLLAVGLMLFLRRSMRTNLDEARQSEQNLRERVAELRQAQVQLEMSEQTLLRREAILETLRVAAERLFRDKSFDRAVMQVLEDLGKATGVDRVYIFENSTNWQGDVLASQRYEWVAEGVVPQINNPDLQDLPLEKSGFSRWLSLLQNNQVVKGHVRDFPLGEKDILSSQRILSIIVVPIFPGDMLWGFIGFDETKWERQWSLAEEDALRGAGGILGGAIERRRVEEALNQSEARYLGILQDQFDLICRYKPDGRLVFGNEAYLRFCGIDRADVEKANMWDQVQPERLEGLRAKVASLTPSEPVAITQYHSRRADGELRWIEWTERGIFNEDGSLLEVQAVGRDIDEEIRLRKQIEESLLKTEMLAMTDALTGLLNRRAIMEHAEAEWNRALREQRPLSLVIMDLDYLKEINDTHGHLVGDQALSQVAGLIRGAMRRYDWAGRWAGDEFLLVLPGTRQRDAVDVAERLRQRIKRTGLEINGDQPIQLQVSLGVAGTSAIEGSDSLQNLLAGADQALYKAKEAGRDQVATTD